MRANGDDNTTNIRKLPPPNYRGSFENDDDSEGAEMSDTSNFVTNRELDAKIESSEYKMAANVAKLEAKIDIGLIALIHD